MEILLQGIISSVKCRMKWKKLFRQECKSN